MSGDLRRIAGAVVLLCAVVFGSLLAALVVSERVERAEQVERLRHLALHLHEELDSPSTGQAIVETLIRAAREHVIDASLDSIEIGWVHRAAEGWRWDALSAGTGDAPGTARSGRTDAPAAWAAPWMEAASEDAGSVETGDRSFIVAFGPRVPAGGTVCVRRDLAEFQAPWRRAGLIGLPLLAVALTLSGVLLLRLVRRMEDRANAGQQHARALFEAAAEPMLTFDAGGVVLAANRAALALLADGRAELLGRPIDQIIPGPRAGTSGRSLLEAIGARGQPRRLEWEARKIDGSAFPASLGLTSADVAGQDLRVLVMRDLTEERRVIAELRASERRVRSILDASPGPIVMHDLEGAIRYSNPAAAMILGYTPTQLASMNVLDFVVERERKSVARGLASIGDLGFLDGVLTLRAKLGDERQWLFRSLLTRRPGEEPLVVSHSIDISDRSRLDEALQLAHSQTELMLDSMSAIVVGVDARGFVTRWNRAAETALAVQASSAIGRSLDELPLDWDAAALRADVALATRDGEPRRIKPLDFVHPERGPGQLGLTLAPLRTPRGQPDGFVLLGADITERLRVEARLADSETRLRSAMDAAQLGISEWDLRSGTVTWAGHHARIFGLTEDEFDGTHEAFERCVSPDDLPALRLSVQQALETRAEYRHDFRVVWRDGSTRWVAGRGRATYGEDGQPVRMFGVVLDVSDRRELELQLVQAQKLESIGQLAAGIAHEINTPTQYVADNVHFLYTSFDGVLELLATYGRLRDAAASCDALRPLAEEMAVLEQKHDLEFLLEEIPRALSQSDEGVQRIAKIVGAMKDFSHPGTETKQPLDLNRCIENTVTVSRNEWKYVAKVETELDPELPLVPGHVGLLQQVLLNLIVNAAHAIGPVCEANDGAKGTIRVTTQCCGEHAVLRVSDTGAGIPAAVQRRVFEPFFTTKQVGKGTGQGLALVRSAVVERHGGSVSFETKEGAGTCFEVRLPLHERQEGVA